MELTKRQRMMLGVLGVAGAALVVDFLLPGPSSASAAAPAAEAGGGGGAVADGGKGAGAGGGGVVAKVAGTEEGGERFMRVIARLREIDASVDRGDPVAEAFGRVVVAAPVVLAEVAEVADSAGPALPEAIPDAVAAPVVLEPTAPVEVVSPPVVRLTSIVGSGDGRVAVIDGELLRAGQMVQGWRIDRIAERSVFLVRGDARARLELGR
ncbi:MAG: hypothetical protein ACTS3F_11255 [Phycisphaerales bacterium]